VRSRPAFETLAMLAAAGRGCGQERTARRRLAAWCGGEQPPGTDFALRKILGEGWIVNVPGRGYRLLVPVMPELDGRRRCPRSRRCRPAVPEHVGDPDQSISRCMVEEITTALSRIGGLFVIARNSAFTYKASRST